MLKAWEDIVKKLTLSAPAGSSVCYFSLHYPQKISYLVMRIKQMIIHINLSKMKNKILPTCLQGNYRDRSREFRSTEYGVFGPEMFKKTEWEFHTLYDSRSLYSFERCKVSCILISFFTRILMHSFNLIRNCRADIRTKPIAAVDSFKILVVSRLFGTSEK